MSIDRNDSNFKTEYLPLIITLIITMFVCVAQIYYGISQNEKLAIDMFKKLHGYYGKILDFN